MSFDIRFKANDEPKVFDVEERHGREGQITIGEFWESFFAATDSWSVADYEASWVDNLAALRRGQNAFFVTVVGGHDSEILFRCWPAFHHEQSIYFTEKLLLRSNAQGVSEAENISELIGFEELKLAIGTGVSFWKIPLSQFS